MIRLSLASLLSQLHTGYKAMQIQRVSLFREQCLSCLFGCAILIYGFFECAPIRGLRPSLFNGAKELVESRLEFGGITVIKIQGNSKDPFELPV